MIPENHWQHDEIANRRENLAMDTSPFGRMTATWLERKSTPNFYQQTFGESLS